MSKGFNRYVWLFIMMLVTEGFTLPNRINNPPKVAIKTTPAGNKIKAGQQLYYTIEVSDAEDGESQYDEINANEVFLEVTFLSNLPDKLHQFSEKQEDPGLTLIKSYQCFNCHSDNANLGSPSFQTVAKKYTNIAPITRSIKTGSSGKWNNKAIMPAHAYIPEEEISQMAIWILALKNQPTLAYLKGISGKLEIEALPNGRFLVLKASYRDHGTLNESGLLGTGMHLFEVL